MSLNKFLKIGSVFTFGAVIASCLPEEEKPKANSQDNLLATGDQCAFIKLDNTSCPEAPLVSELQGQNVTFKGEKDIIIAKVGLGQPIERAVWKSQDGRETTFSLRSGSLTAHGEIQNFLSMHPGEQAWYVLTMHGAGVFDSTLPRLHIPTDINTKAPEIRNAILGKAACDLGRFLYANNSTQYSLSELGGNMGRVMACYARHNFPLALERKGPEAK